MLSHSWLDSGPEAELREAPARCDGPRALILESREVPLGGVRGMAVHRALPQRDLPLVGAWCFLDSFGPQRTRMRVEPHPVLRPSGSYNRGPLTGRVACDRSACNVASDFVASKNRL